MPRDTSRALYVLQVWRFILEREVEAPERFQAIQSYRATMAVLRQQALFVEQLFDTGVIDEMEKEELLQCVSLSSTEIAPHHHMAPCWSCLDCFDCVVSGRVLDFLN